MTGSKTGDGGVGIVMASVLSVIAASLLWFQYLPLANGVREVQLEMIHNTLILVMIMWPLALGSFKSPKAVLGGAIAYGILCYLISLLITNDVSAKMVSSTVRGASMGGVLFAITLYYSMGAAGTEGSPRHGIAQDR